MGHLMKDSMHFLSCEDLTERFNIKTNFLTFQGVISAIKALWKSNAEKLHNITTNYETFTDTFLKAKQPNRLAYKILVSKKQKKPVKAQRKNGLRIAAPKPKKTLIGTQFTDHLFYAQKSQN